MAVDGEILRTCSTAGNRSRSIRRDQKLPAIVAKWALRNSGSKVGGNPYCRARGTLHLEPKSYAGSSASMKKTLVHITLAGFLGVAFTGVAALAEKTTNGVARQPAFSRTLADWRIRPAAAVQHTANGMVERSAQIAGQWLNGAFG